MYLRCYIDQEKSGTWYAACIDLCLYAPGDTPQIAKENLEIMIKDYIHDAHTVDKESHDYLMSRKAPLALRLTYYKIAFIYNFFKLLNIGDRKNKNYSSTFQEIIPIC